MPGTGHLTGTMPLVTVITVVYNGAPHLEETIRSLQEMDARFRIEHIIVDGGSHDGTVDVIRRNEQRIAWWCSEPDNGIYDAMNKGWQAASPDSFILFLGAGDRLLSLPESLASYTPQDVVYGDVQLAGRLFRGRAGFGLKCNNTLHHQALLVHRSLHPAPPFDTRFRVYADFDFNQRLMKLGARFVRADGFRASALPGGLSSRKAHRETLMIVRKNLGVGWCVIAVCFLVIRKMLSCCGGEP